MNSKAIILTALMVFASSVFLINLWAEQRMAPESAPLARGADYAAFRGCVGCHGDPGDLLADANDGACSDVNEMSWHPDYDVECTDVMAYFESVRLRRNFEARAGLNTASTLMAGEKLAREYHCFNCHGQLGQGGFKNSGSLKGYVPGYFGADFMLLTRDANPDSVRQWIMHGVDPAILETPVTGLIARYIFWRQDVGMPSFKSLKPEEIDILVKYVITLHQFGPMTAEMIRSYGGRSRSTEALANSDRGVESKLLEPLSANQ